MSTGSFSVGELERQQRRWCLPIATHDVRRDTQKQREAWQRVRRAERYYAVQLRKVANQIGHVVSAFDINDPQYLDEMIETLHRYGAILAPWARSIARRMLYEVARRDERAWSAHAKLMGQEIKQIVSSTPIGATFQQLMDEQVNLITSLPRDAAIRVHELAMKQLYEGGRAKEIAADIRNSHAVSEARANLIARTEIGRASTMFQKVRAEAIGSEGYVWRTARDARVRPLHKKLEGTYHRWDDPPVAGEAGERSHPGAIYNCFAGDTLIGPSAGVSAVFRGFYRGPIVSLEVGKSFLRVTPNHPILTPVGLKSAGSLQIGDELCCMPRDGLGAIKQEIDRQVTTFQQLFEALTCSAANVETLPINSFYGDVLADDKVQVVRRARCLQFRRETMLDQQVSNFNVASADSRIWTAVSRSLEQSIEAALSCSGNPLRALFVRADQMARMQAFASASAQYAGLPQGSQDWAGRSVEFLSQLWDSPPSFVEIDNLCDGEIGDLVASGNLEASFVEMLTQGISPDPELLRHRFESRAADYECLRIVNSSISDFSGHVYTAETAVGYYGTGHQLIASKNCRCYAEPVLPALY